MKNTHWYLRSWEYEERLNPDGTARQELVYKGEYYHISGISGCAGLKAAYLSLTALLWAVLALLLTHISRGASLFFVGGACGLALIPAIYLAIGSIRLIGLPRIMTYRDVHASFHRIRGAAKWILGLMSVCLAGELFYLVFRLANGYPVAWRAESLWAVGAAIGVAVPAAVFALLRRYRVELCPKGMHPAEQAK